MERLEEFLRKKEERLVALRQEIQVLKLARVPLMVNKFSDGFELFSEDYSLAENFKIQKRRGDLGGFSGPEGGCHTSRYETYPQFYFNLRTKMKILPVYICHDGFDKDEGMVIRSVTRTEGYKEYSSENRTIENYIDLIKVFDFFRKKGVKEKLLIKLASRIKQSEEF